MSEQTYNCHFVVRRGLVGGAVIASAAAVAALACSSGYYAAGYALAATVAAVLGGLAGGLIATTSCLLLRAVRGSHSVELRAAVALSLGAGTFASWLTRAVLTLPVIAESLVVAAVGLLTCGLAMSTLVRVISHQRQ